ncbi:MAG: hypothetical protein AAFO85_07415 [Cyanobacteria bacterium J06598_4]
MDRNWAQIEDEPDAFPSYLKAKAYSTGSPSFFWLVQLAKLLASADLAAEQIKLRASEQFRAMVAFILGKSFNRSLDTNDNTCVFLGRVICNYLAPPFLFSFGLKRQNSRIFVQESI